MEQETTYHHPAEVMAVAVTEDNKMTVKELIEKLQQFDENKQVIIDTDSFYYELDDIHSVELQHFTERDDNGNEVAKVDQVVIG